MKLSGAYDGMVVYAMVYHTQPGSEQVEFVSPRFFRTEKKAWKWFNKKFIPESFVEPECVEVSSLSFLSVSKAK
jgi:hypothetical protein